MSKITTATVRAYIAHRQAQKIVRGKGEKRSERAVSNAEINRELAILKRAFTLAAQAGKVLYRPHIPMLRERNVRTGFFEVRQFQAVRNQLPAVYRPVVTFAYVTGRRVPSEVLRLEWRHVDLTNGIVALDPGMTKNE